MPRYLFETNQTSDPQRVNADRLAVVRFPEVAVEHRYTDRGDHDRRELWVCKAPSAAHIQRFAAAAELVVAAVRHVDDVVPRPEQPRLRPDNSVQRPTGPVQREVPMTTITTTPTAHHRPVTLLALVAVLALALVAAVAFLIADDDSPSTTSSRPAATSSAPSATTAHVSADAVDRAAATTPSHVCADAIDSAAATTPSPAYASPDSIDRRPAVSESAGRYGSADAAERSTDG
jgi:hypothetical protein